MLGQLSCHQGHRIRHFSQDDNQCSSREQGLNNVEAVAGCLVGLEDQNIRELRKMYAGKVDLITSTPLLPLIIPIVRYSFFLPGCDEPSHSKQDTFEPVTQQDRQ